MGRHIPAHPTAVLGTELQHAAIKPVIPGPRGGGGGSPVSPLQGSLLACCTPTLPLPMPTVIAPAPNIFQHTPTAPSDHASPIPAPYSQPPLSHHVPCFMPTTHSPPPPLPSTPNSHPSLWVVQEACGWQGSPHHIPSHTSPPTLQHYSSYERKHSTS